jgi:flagellin-like hook-associated protein FlgL
MVRDVVPGAAIKSTLTSIQRSREALDRTSERLATGLRVNRAIDQPQNFFSAYELNATAGNFSKLLDKMNLGVRTIQQALAGVEQLENMLQLAENKVLDAQETLEKTANALPDLIRAENPDAYFQLYDVGEGTANNLGNNDTGVQDGTYVNGVQQNKEVLFYGAGGSAAEFSPTGATGNPYVDIPADTLINNSGPYNERTVELVFNADTVNGRQVLWEEGGRIESMSIYIDNGRLYVNGRTLNGPNYGPLNISTEIEAGKTYHVALTQRGGIPADPGEFTGYINGQAFGSAPINASMGNHPEANGIGAVHENIYFHDDGPFGSAPVRLDGSFAFDGKMSDVAVYNRLLTTDDLKARYEATSLPLAESLRVDMQDFLEQIEGIVEDTSYRGINLLDKEKLVVDFNDKNTSKLSVDGAAFDLQSLKLDQIDFQRPSQVRDALINIRKAIAQVRDFGSTLANDLSIIESRKDFTQQFVNTYKAGATDLTIADQNEEGANLLAQQIRVALGTEALGLAGQSSRSILEIFGSGSNLFVR